jgi:ketosteroid isomerase-like protein
MSQEHKDIVKKVDEAFTTNSLEDFYAHCTDDIEWTMAGEGTHKGIDNIRQMMQKATEDCGASFPKIFVTKMIADGDSVASYGTMSMKNKDGNDDHFDYCDIYDFRDGKIAKLISFVIKGGGDSK